MTHLRLDVHPLPLYTGGALNDVDVGGGESVTRLGPGGDWEDRFSEAVQESDADGTIAVTTVSYEGDGVHSPRPHATGAYDVVTTDDHLGTMSIETVHDVLAQGAAAAEPTDETLDCEWSERLDGLVPDLDDDIDELEREAVMENYIDLIGELEPEAARELSPDTVAALRPDRVGDRMEGQLRARDDDRVDELRKDWRKEFDTDVKDAYEELVRPLADDVETVTFGGGTFTKCQNGIISNVLGVMDGIQARIDLDTTFVADASRVPNPIKNRQGIGGILAHTTLDGDARERTEQRLADNRADTVPEVGPSANVPLRDIRETLRAWQNHDQVELLGELPRTGNQHPQRGGPSVGSDRGA